MLGPGGPSSQVADRMILNGEVHIYIGGNRIAECHGDELKSSDERYASTLPRSPGIAPGASPQDYLIRLPHLACTLWAIVQEPCYRVLGLQTPPNTICRSLITQLRPSSLPCSNCFSVDMHISSFVGLAAAYASVTAAQKVLPPQPDFQYDETADWYRDHGMPVPEVSSQITTVKANRSYVVKLECPDCPFLVKDGREVSWQERDNALVRPTLCKRCSDRTKPTTSS
jgi:hypothetical protein